MKAVFKLLSAVLVTASFGLASCSNNDDEPENNQSVETSPKNVLSQGLPAEVDGYTFNTNDKGQVTSISYDNSIVATFEYGKFTRAATYDVLMKIPDGDTNIDIYIQTNNQGFATHALEVYNDDYPDDTWDFEYNSAGQLMRLKRSEGGDDFKITYSNGDIIKVVQDDEDGYHYETLIKYTDEKNPSVVPNKGNIMLFDELFYIDMDEMGIAYYAGLLGKSTNNLPIGCVDTDDPESSRSYNWNLNTNGLPNELNVVESWDGDEYIYTYKFSWK